MAASAANNTDKPGSFEERLTKCSQTDVGQAREKNEDNLGHAGPEETGKGWLFVVADGMGGAAAGRTASTLAVDKVKEEYCEYVKAKPLDSPFSALKYAIERANLAIFERSRSDESCYGMGTTVVAMAVVGDNAYTAHVGDSRIYRWRDGRLEKMMRDHTRVQMLSDQGIITPAEANDHPESHVINRNLGGRADVEVDTPTDGPFSLVDGDTYLLCSDGLHGLVPDEAILRVMSMAPPEHSAPALIELANRRGGYDNITVSLVTAGELPSAWGDFNEGAFRKVVDELAFEETSDTALFEAYDPDALGPAEFETGRLKAISAGGASSPMPTRGGQIHGSDKDDEEKPKGGAARNTVMLQSPITAQMLQAAAAQQTTQMSETSPKVRNPTPFLLIGIFATLFFLLIVVVVAAVFFLK